MVTGGDHFGAMGPFWWVLGCLCGAFGVLLGRFGGPKKRRGKPQGGSQGHLGSKRPLEGSWWGSGRLPDAPSRRLASCGYPGFVCIGDAVA